MMCNDTSVYGEVVSIRVNLEGFTEYEIQTMQVFRLGIQNPGELDSFMLMNMLIPGHSGNSYVTLSEPRSSNSANEYGLYDSYLHQSHLILDWYTGRDTLSNFEVFKSKAFNSDKCHENDPNVRIDKLEFDFHGKRYVKGESITISK